MYSNHEDMITLSQKGEYKMITLKDVAREAGVSLSTASRAFRENVYISPEKREHILKIASQIGYTPNLTARSLREDRSRTIGMMLLGEMDFLECYVEQILHQYGYRLLIVYTNGKREYERGCLESLISSRVDGMICFFSNYANQDLIQQCEKNAIPILQVFGQQYTGLHTAIIDDNKLSYDITRMLIDRGHRSILFAEHFLDSEQQANLVNEEYYGYARAMKEIGVEVRQEDFFLLPHGNRDGYEVLRERVLREKPTAVIAGVTDITIVFLKIFRDLNMEVGKDVSLIAYDNNPWCDYLGLAALDHNFEMIGEYCADAIVNLVSGQTEKVPMMKKFISKFIARPSMNFYGSFDE